MKKGLILCLICLTPALIFAAKVGVLHLKAVGVDPGTAEVVSGLLAGELSNVGYQVLNPDAMDAAVGERLTCYETGCAAEAGSVAGVEQVIFGSVSRLGEKHIVQLSVVSVSTREVIWSGSLSAKIIEDLDMVAKRLAKSIAEGKEPEKTVEVGIVLEEEEKKPLRRRVFHTAGIRAGMILPTGGYADVSSLLHLGLLYWYETPNFAAEISFYFAFSGGQYDDNVTEICMPEFSLLYFFNKGDVSPYLGGGIGFGILDLGYFDAEYDICVNGGGGVVFLRTYDIRLILDVRYRVNMASIQGYDSPHHGIMFSIGFTYRPKKFCCL